MDGFLIKNGINESQIEQLIYFANTDEEVQKNTSDRVRFADKAAFEQWMKKGRSIYILTNSSNELLGIFWIGEKPMPAADYFDSFDGDKYGITFGIRIYGQARGKGLSFEFMSEAIERFMKSPAYALAGRKGIWLQTVDNNLPATKLYERSGFKTVSSPNENHEIIMVKS